MNYPQMRIRKLEMLWKNNLILQIKYKFFKLNFEKWLPNYPRFRVTHKKL